MYVSTGMPARPAGVHVIFTLVVPGVPDSAKDVGTVGDSAIIIERQSIYLSPSNYNKLKIEVN